MSQRFSVEGELSRIDSGLTDDAQKEWGTYVEWYRYDESTSAADDLYDVGAPRRWGAPLLIPVLWIIREEGVDTYDQDGLYTTESLQIAVAKHALRDKLHWTDVATLVQRHLKDRIVFEGHVFTISSFQVQGQLLNRDVIIGIQANMVRSDQYVWDPEFTPAEPSAGSISAEADLGGVGETP